MKNNTYTQYIEYLNGYHHLPYSNNPTVTYNLIPRWRPVIDVPENKRGLSGATEVVPRLWLLHSSCSLVLSRSEYKPDKDTLKEQLKH